MCKLLYLVSLKILSNQSELEFIVKVSCIDDFGCNSSLSIMLSSTIIDGGEEEVVMVNALQEPILGEYMCTVHMIKDK